MHILIDTYGAVIEAENGLFVIGMEDNIRKISPLKTSSINLLCNCMISTAALLLAAKHEVPVLVYNKTGSVEAWVWGGNYGNISTIRRKQAFFCETPLAAEWAVALMAAKAKGQIGVLTYLKDRVPAQKTALENAITAISKLMENLLKPVPNDRHRGDFLSEMIGYEGKIGVYYWEALTFALQKYATFNGRVQRNPPDIFNASINYVYGILYGLVESSLLMSGLDPYMGIIHTDRYQQPTLAFDHIEPFRPRADRLVATLVMQQTLKEQDMELNEEGLYRINKTAKRILIDTFFQEMETRSELNGKRIKNRDHIHYLSSQLVKKLKNFEIPGI